MKEEPCPELRRRICPFISCGEQLVYCKGTQCNACKPIPIEEGTVWVCILIDREFASDCEERNEPYF